MRAGADIFSIMSSHFLALVSSIPSWHDGIDSGIDLYLGYTRLTRCWWLTSVPWTQQSRRGDANSPLFSCGFLLLVHVEQATPFLCSSTMMKDNMKVPETLHPQMTAESLSAHPHADGKSVKFHSTQDILETLDDIKEVAADYI